MKIDYTKGNKGKKDRIIRVTTKEKEWFSIFKLSLLTNQLAINELKINGEKIKTNGNFFFKNALNESIEMAELGLDWGEEKNMSKIKQWCKKWMVNFEKIEPELRKQWQSKLEDFENGE